MGNRGSFNRFYGKDSATRVLPPSATRQFGTDHTLTAGLYNEVIKNSANSFFYTGYGLERTFRERSGHYTPGNATNGFIPAVGGAETDGFNPDDRIFPGGKNALLSFTIINYGFRNRYFLTLGARTDGSSRFGENYRFANFGSIGASWIVSEEAFMAGLKNSLFNELKFKISYGSAGNQAGIGSYQARELYGRGVQRRERPATKPNWPIRTCGGRKELPSTPEWKWLPSMAA